MTDSRQQTIHGAGGSPGGLGQFFLGLILLVVGMYLFLSRVIVFSNLWSIYGFNAFGVALIPFMIGLVLLFFNAKSFAGWVLSVGSFLIIFIGIITNLTFFFMPTNLLVTLLMLGMIAAGIGLILRSFKAH